MNRKVDSFSLQKSSRGIIIFPLRYFFMGASGATNCGTSDNLLMEAAAGIWRVNARTAPMLTGSAKDEREQAKPSLMIHMVTEATGQEILQQVPSAATKAIARRNLGFYELSANEHSQYPQVTDVEIDMTARAMDYLPPRSACSHAGCMHQLSIWLLKLQAQATEE